VVELNKAERIYEEIFSRIRGEVYTTKLPSESELAEEFQANVKTVAKALGTLSQEGVIERKRRRGTYILNPRRRPLRPALSFLAARDNIFHEENPYRHHVLTFLERLWEEASKKNIPLNLLPHMSQRFDVSRYLVPGHTGNYVVMFGGQGGPKVVRDLLESGFKPFLVGMDRDYYPAYRILPFAAVDNRIEAAYVDLAANMKSRGRRRIGLVYAATGKDKFPIFRKALDDVGLEFDPQRVVKCEDTDFHGALVELLGRRPTMDGLIVRDNRAGHDAIAELNRRGMRVPQNVAVACVDGILDGPPWPGHTYTHMQPDYVGIAREIVSVVSKNQYRPGTTYFHMRLIQGTTT